MQEMLFALRCFFPRPKQVTFRSVPELSRPITSVPGAGLPSLVPLLVRFWRYPYPTLALRFHTFRQRISVILLRRYSPLHRLTRLVTGFCACLRWKMSTLTSLVIFTFKQKLVWLWSIPNIRLSRRLRRVIGRLFVPRCSSSRTLMLWPFLYSMVMLLLYWILARVRLCTTPISLVSLTLW